MHPPAVRKGQADTSWRTRVESLRHVGPLLAMVWETSPPLMLATVFLRLLRALIPLAMLWVSKLILDALVAWKTRGAGNPGALLGDRFTNRVSVRLMQHATRLLRLPGAYLADRYLEVLCRIYMENKVVAVKRAVFGSLLNLLSTAGYYGALFLRDLFDFFAMEPRIGSRAGALSAPRPIRLGFEFRGVGFAYPGAGRHVLKKH